MKQKIKYPHTKGFKAYAKALSGRKLLEKAKEKADAAKR